MDLGNLMISFGMDFKKIFGDVIHDLSLFPIELQLCFFKGLTFSLRNAYFFYFYFIFLVIFYYKFLDNLNYFFFFTSLHTTNYIYWTVRVISTFRCGDLRRFALCIPFVWRVGTQLISSGVDVKKLSVVRPLRLCVALVTFAVVIIFCWFS